MKPRIKQTNTHVFSDRILRRDLVRGPKLAYTVTELTGADKESFLDFASGMLEWVPEKRKTAKQLLQHSFFDSFHKEGEALKASKAR